MTQAVDAAAAEDKKKNAGDAMETEAEEGGSATQGGDGTANTDAAAEKGHSGGGDDDGATDIGGDRVEESNKDASDVKNAAEGDTVKPASVSKETARKEDDTTTDGLADDEDIACKGSLASGGDEQKEDDDVIEKNDAIIGNEEEDPFAGLDEVATMDLYNIGNYTFGKKEEKSKCKGLSDMSDREIAAALRREYTRQGMRRSVRAVVLVHEHNFAHILLLQRSDGKREYVLPGGRLRPGENFEEGLLRKLGTKLCPLEAVGDASEVEGDQPVLEVGDKLGKWYAIDFTRKYFPYIPAHVSKAKEEVHVYTVSLPSNFMFAVPRNLQLVAVPLCDVHNNTAVYGSIISAVPALLSRFHINLC